ncbi:MAG: lysoplasmalogenase [Actinomycetota bacterium]
MNFQILRLIYFGALAIEIFASLTENLPLHYVSKPLLMPILLFYYAINTKKFASAKYPVMAALIFSWFGDVLLLLDKVYKTFFIYGLMAFLAAHIFYIFYFWKIRKLNNVAILPNALIFVGIAAYILALFTYVAPNVQNLLVPVAVYAFIISVMFTASLTAFDLSKQTFGKICVAGTFLFLVSDSILAINRFVAPFPLAPVLIMLTYAGAQLLITEGSLRNLLKISHE